MSAAVESSHKKCKERDALQATYSTAISLWARMGGTDPLRMHLPVAIAATRDLDHIAKQLIDHRHEHGC